VTRFVFQCVAGLAAVLLVSSCSVVQRILPEASSTTQANRHAAMAMEALRELQEVDAFIRLDNELLVSHIGAVLADQVAASPAFSFSRLRVRAGRQVISLDARLLVFGAQEEPLKAALAGDVLLTYSGGQLVWLPRFSALRVTDTGFVFDGEAYTEATPEMEALLLQRVNKEISDAAIVLGKNSVRISALPIGSIEVGAALTDFPGVVAKGAHDLGGVFTVKGSAILIEPAVTSIALDLEFTPNISSCPADVFVSRSTFASAIENREPVSVTRILADSEVESHFFTEISGATRPTAVIHYWFADGVPVWLEELPVEPSYRWRTWSSRRVESRLARNWEVIVVEKSTGCILHSQAIRVEPSVSGAAEEIPPALDAFETFVSTFQERVADFTISAQRPEVALIEVRRAFLGEVLHTSLRDIQIVVNFDAGDLPLQQLSGTLEPFSADNIVCEQRSCTTPRSCPGDFTLCARERDMRDCTRCLFKNPLNNRCVTEATDPICQAAKTAQNTKYDAARNACIEQEAADRENCNRLATQELQSCELESAAERTACEEGKASVQRFANAPAFADIELKLQASGKLSAVFSDFRLEEDLESLRLNLGLSGALNLAGSIRFAPRSGLGPLTQCMNAWQKSFRGRVVLPYRAHSMIAAVTDTPSMLGADWSGFVLAATISPAPLEAMFVDNPSLLAGCRIGLTVDKVAREVSGDASEYLAGRYRLEIQPSQSRIRLSDASVSLGDAVYTAQPVLSARYLKFQVQK